MFCQKCGKEMSDSAKFCTNCGWSKNGVNPNAVGGKKFNLPIIPIVAIVAVLVVGFFASKIFMGGGSIAKDAKLVTSYSTDTTIDQMETVKFGSYYQNDAFAKEPIEWIVLDRQGGRTLLLSKYILDCKCYNNESKDVTWETCDLRNWLNNDFYYNAFSDKEQGKILMTNVINNNNIDYGTNGGNNTNDKVFCLSIEETRKYFGNGTKNDAWGTDTDTDNDNLNDNVEAYEEEELDIRSFVEDYCRYNNITGEELQRYLTMYGKTKVYNFKSSPVLPDTDFDGRNDKRDQGHPLDNQYKIDTTSNNYNVSVDFNMDYRYFFMKSSDYYAELSKMSAMLANAILKDNKTFTVTNENNYTKSGIKEYMYWLGMDTGTFIGEDGDVPYAINCHDVVYKDKVKNVIAIVVGEKDEYKGILESNSDDESYEHSGFVEKAEYIYDKFTDYDSTKSGDKVYWIVGYGTGGSVANILADRIIDDKGADIVYCYTFAARGVVDTSKIQENETVNNIQNYSIFNLRNIDDAKLMGIGDKWFLYGKDAKFSIACDDDSKREFNRIVSNQDYKYNYKSIGEFFKNIFDAKKRNEIMLERNDKISSDIGAYIASALKEVSSDHIPPFYFAKYHGAVYDLGQVYIELIADLAKKREEEKEYIKLLDSIEKGARYYINHVATYQSNLGLSNGRVRETNPALSFLKPSLIEFDEKHRKTKPNQLFDDEYKIRTSYYESGVGDDTKIVNREYTLGTNKGKNVYKYDSVGWYKWFGYIVDIAINNAYINSDEKKYTRDDCSGFAKLILTLNSGGKYQTSISSGDLLNCKAKKSIELMEMGYTMYVLDDATKTWNKYWYDEDYIKEHHGQPPSENVGKMSASKLKPGDMLVCNSTIGHRYNDSMEWVSKNVAGHIEFYIGYEYPNLEYNKSIDDEQNINIRKKSGIKIIGKRERLEPEGNKAEGTFGWGNVIDEYPTESYSRTEEPGDKHSFYYDSATGAFRHCECGNTPNAVVTLRLVNGKKRIVYDGPQEGDVVSSAHDDAFCDYNNRLYNVIFRLEKKEVRYDEE